MNSDKVKPIETEPSDFKDKVKQINIRDIPGMSSDFKDKVKQIRTGDILLFCRKDFIGKWIRSLTYSRWTHVGIAVRIKGNKSKDPGGEASIDNFKVVSSGGKLYVMEAIMDDWDDDFLSNTVKQNFRVTPIEYRMNKNYCSIAYRSVKSHLIHKDYLERTKKFLLEHKDARFYKSEFQLFKLWLGFNPNSHVTEDKTGERKKEYCCTTIAGKYLRKALGIPIDEHLIPTSFSYHECDHHGHILKDYYDPEVNFWHHPEEWHESIGLMLAFLIIWIIFWWVTADIVFKS